MSEYKETPTLGGTDNRSKEEFVVTLMVETGHKFERIVKQVTHRGISKWQIQDQTAEDQTNAAQMQKYIEALCNPDVIRVAVNGSAGTGKTYTAMAYASMAIRAGIVHRLRCTRPTVSCGSGSGFLPGTSAQKQAPWSAPCTEAAERNDETWWKRESKDRYVASRQDKRPITR